MKRFDLIFIVCVLLVAIGFYFFLSPGEKGTQAVIYVDGKEYGRLTLEKEGEFVIEQGDKKNVLTVQNGMIFMQEASCPDKVCIRQGKISRGKETIVCLPNKVRVEIEGEESSGLDAIAQ